MQWYALAVDWSLQSSSYRVTGDGVQPWIFFFVWGCRALSKQSWTQSRNRNVHRTSEKLIVFFLDSLALIIPDPAWQSQDFDGYVFCSEISHWFMTPASTEKVDFGKTQFNNKKHNQTQNDQNSGIDWFPLSSEWSETDWSPQVAIRTWSNTVVSSEWLLASSGQQLQATESTGFWKDLIVRLCIFLYQTWILLEIRLQKVP